MPPRLLDVLLRHVSPTHAATARPSVVGPAASADPQASAPLRAAANTRTVKPPPPPALKPLTEAQVEEFAQMGYLVLPIDELGPEVCPCRSPSFTCSVVGRDREASWVYRGASC